MIEIHFEITIGLFLTFQWPGSEISRQKRLKALSDRQIIATFEERILTESWSAVSAQNTSKTPTTGQNIDTREGLPNPKEVAKVLNLQTGAL